MDDPGETALGTATGGRPDCLAGAEDAVSQVVGGLVAYQCASGLHEFVESTDFPDPAGHATPGPDLGVGGIHDGAGKRGGDVGEFDVDLQPAARRFVFVLGGEVVGHETGQVAYGQVGGSRTRAVQREVGRELHLPRLLDTGVNDRTEHHRVRAFQHRARHRPHRADARSQRVDLFVEGRKTEFVEGLGAQSELQIDELVDGVVVIETDVAAEWAVGRPLIPGLHEVPLTVGEVRDPATVSNGLAPGVVPGHALGDLETGGNLGQTPVGLFDEFFERVQHVGTYPSRRNTEQDRFSLALSK